MQRRNICTYAGDLVKGAMKFNVIFTEQVRLPLVPDSIPHSCLPPSLPGPLSFPVPMRAPQAALLLVG